MHMNNQRGFSLVEIMIVVVIIGLIATIAGNKLLGSKDKANVRATKVMIQQLADALEMYNTDCNTYPSTDQGLEALIEEPGGDPACDAWGPGPYLKKLPKDAWGGPFYYESDGVEFNITSFGKGRKEGGADFQKDIQYKDL